MAPEGDRTAFLEEACAGDEALHREVESLLAQESAASQFLDGPAAEVAAHLMTDEPGTLKSWAPIRRMKPETHASIRRRKQRTVGK